MIYLDANIFVYALGNIDIKTQACIKILDKIVKGEIEAYTSLLTWDEFLHAIRKQMGREQAVSEGAKFLNFPNLIFLGVDGKVIVRAQELISKYNIKPRGFVEVRFLVEAQFYRFLIPYPITIGS